MNNRELKALKGQYCRIFIIKIKDIERVFRAPTCDEASRYISIKNIDPEAAIYYIIKKCSLDNLELEELNEKEVLYLDATLTNFTSLSIDNYNKLKLSNKSNSILEQIYRISIGYGLNINYLLGLSLNELMEHIVIIENVTGTDIIPKKDSTRKSKSYEEEIEQFSQSYKESLVETANKYKEILQKQNKMT